MLGFAILLGFNFLGYVIQLSLHLPLPGNVIGLILFTAALFTKLVKLSWVEVAASLLTRHMMLFFIPFTVGVLAYIPIIGANWLAICGGTLGATLAVLVVTGWVSSKLGQESTKYGK
ncbi:MULTISPECIES: CidA/LrgA family protein [unclassified Paenibacillus]|uniref:CidA/LrgA family protein n=1 Tax=unclassified Paenibacillus TaxID=185978 RepID=UPI0027851DB0|nr:MULTISPECIES: CidA/LrgA family protein [unclassified Paenibacillus]MDQ0898573.1 holin-like protein [Paenibacillus sp. V4I7]MDQ0915436.1 holin-like protein [Paenibacillus sp. V4I5]